MKLSQIKAKQAVFQPVDPIHGELIEDVHIHFKHRSETAAYDKFSTMISTLEPKDTHLFAEAFFGILEKGELGGHEFSVDGLHELFTNADSAFIAEQILGFFTEKSNFFTIETKAEKKKK